ncbi:MAG: hypothetical protein JNL67_16880 [Planctomycetaceae bacterium]|nr:hypothetical protein [Planctomycetaceae bacterium]
MPTTPSINPELQTLSGYAAAVQLFAEYDPMPPLDKGSVAKASPEISGLLLHMHEPFRQMVRDMAKSV